MSLKNALLTLLIGRSSPKPAPQSLMERLQNVEVTHDDSGKSGFQLTFEAGRSGPDSLMDTACYLTPQLRPFSRVVITITFNAIPRVLMDGIITNIQYSPDSSGGSSTFTVTGEDVSIMMDLEEKDVGHSGLSEYAIAGKIIRSYSYYGLIPQVIQPDSSETPEPMKRIPFQHATDLAYLNKIAKRFGYLFYIIPGPDPLTNTAYWGPPIRKGPPQKALSVNLGHVSNVVSINFAYNALSATKVSGKLHDIKSKKTITVRTETSHRETALVSEPALASGLRSRTILTRYSGLTLAQAQSQAQGLTDSSVDNVATASGELDVLRYGNILQPRSLVDIRGAGYSNDGSWYVKKATHKIKQGEYRQSFILSREGMGSKTSRVVV